MGFSDFFLGAFVLITILALFCKLGALSGVENPHKNCTYYGMAALRLGTEYN